MVMRYAHSAPDYKLDAVSKMEQHFKVPTDTTVAPEAIHPSRSVN